MQQCIKNNDIKGLRRALGTIIYTDRNFKKGELSDAINYITHNAKIDKLFEKFDSSIPLISSSKNNFSDDDFADAVYYLQNNFCYERINDVKKIGTKLYSK